jgi:hypothetical protein
LREAPTLHLSSYPRPPAREKPTLELLPWSAIYIYIYIYIYTRRHRVAYPGAAYPGAPYIYTRRRRVAYPRGAYPAPKRLPWSAYPAAARPLQGRPPLWTWPDSPPGLPLLPARPQGPRVSPKTPAPGYPEAPYGPSPGRPEAPRPRGSPGPPVLGSWPHSHFPQYSFAWETGQIDSRETTYPVPTLERQASRQVEADRLARPSIPSPFVRLPYTSPAPAKTGRGRLDLTKKKKNHQTITTPT